MQQADILHTYDGLALVKRICDVYVLSGLGQQALKQLEYLQTIFKPDTIPQNYEEYTNLCNRNGNTTLLEYADITKTIAVIKASENMNYNKELKEVQTIYNVVYDNNTEEMKELSAQLLEISKKL